jgi:hypothetical protein
MRALALRRSFVYAAAVSDSESGAQAIPVIVPTTAAASFDIAEA